MEQLTVWFLLISMEAYEHKSNKMYLSAVNHLMWYNGFTHQPSGFYVDIGRYVCVRV